MTKSIPSVLEGSLDLDDLEGLDYVALLDVVVVLDTDTALHSGDDFLGVLLASLEGSQVSGVDNDAVTDKTNLGALGELSFLDEGTGDRADLRYLERLLDDSSRGNFLFLLRLEHTFDTVLDLVDRVVDDGVETDFDSFLLCSAARVR